MSAPEVNRDGTEAGYYRSIDGRYQGPFSRQELSGQLLEGTLQPEDLVQVEGTAFWQPVHVVLSEIRPRETQQPEAGEQAPNEELPGWPVLWRIVLARLRQDVLNRPSPLVLLAGLAIGALVVAALAIPFLLGQLTRPEPRTEAAAHVVPNRIVSATPAREPLPAATPFVLSPPSPPAPTVPVTSVPDAPAAVPATPPSVAAVSSAPPVVNPPVPAVAPAVPVPASTETAVATPAAETPTSGEFVLKHNRSLVIIRGGNSSGSGFIAEQGGKMYLFTNNHVAAGMKTPTFTLMDGTRIGVTAPESAVGHDIMRFALRDQPKDNLQTAGSLESTVRIDDDVFVLGNAGGAGVVTSLPGKIVGIGPDRVEVSAAFIPGNSGSPIVHATTGRVIGIATYLMRRHEEFVPGTTMVVRRFGYRLDSVQTWEPVNWLGFQAEAERIEKISTLSEDIFNFLESVQAGKAPTFATEALRRASTDYEATMARKQISVQDRRGAAQSFLSTLRYMSKSDVSAAEGQLHYSFFRDKLSKERIARDALYKAFDQRFNQLSSNALSR